MELRNMCSPGRAKEIMMDLGAKALKKLEKLVPPSRAFNALPPEMDSMLSHARRRIISIVLVDHEKVFKSLTIMLLIQ